jgi:hypothetical protein
VLAFLLPSASSLAGESHKLELRDLRIPIHADAGPASEGVLSIDRVFTESRRMGFFRVKLLSVQVAQGVCVELSQTQPGTNWPGAFSFKPFQSEKGAPVEWRDVSVRIAGESAPRLHADRLTCNPRAESGFPLADHATLRTPAGPISVAKARLLTDGSGAGLVWESGGATLRWDFLTETVVTLPARSTDCSL